MQNTQQQTAQTGGEGPGKKPEPRPMRAVRRFSERVNEGKWGRLTEMFGDYRDEKNTHLAFYNDDQHFIANRGERVQRDELLGQGYASPFDLQGRMWKAAQKDAYETVLKTWASQAASLRAVIGRREEWSEAQRHYAYWLVYTPRRLAELVTGRAPLPGAFEISMPERRTVQNNLRRHFHRQRGQRPHARMARSACFDSDMHKTFEHKGRQYISIMSEQPRQPITIPLTGHATIRGTIRVVLDRDKQRVEVHSAFDIPKPEPLTGPVLGLDAGVSEVYTDDLGEHYGTEYGKVVAEGSRALRVKGKRRNKLHHVAKQAVRNGDLARADKIRRHNLGRKKQRRQKARLRETMRRITNQAMNRILRERKPRLIVHERLDLRGKARSKEMSRQVNLWARAILKQSTSWSALLAGCETRQVNTAYSSQTCPACGWVSRDNRHGDTFLCQKCRHRDDADRVAASNLKARLNDPEITLWAPRERVKVILLKRYNARLESQGGDAQAAEVTVAGRVQVARRESRPVRPDRETTCVRRKAGKAQGTNSKERV